MTIRHRSLTALAALALALPCEARAQQPELGWRWSGVLFGRMNPLAVGTDLDLRYRRRLYEDRRPLFALNHAQVAAGLAVSPASVKPSLGLELQPLSVLTLGVSYEPVYYLGALGNAQSYPSPRSPLGGSAFGAVEEGPGGAYALVVHQLVLHGAVQARVKALALRASVRATRIEADLHGADRVVYDPAHDVLVYRRGWVAQSDVDLAWLASDRLLLGVRHSLVTAWYPEAAFPAGERRGLRDRTTSRLGPLVRYTVFKGRGGVADEGSLIVAAQWWLAHPDRTGRTSPSAVPLALVGVQVTGGP